jgi:23S rRNA (guanosine2251-2'-O)-methyltransferase
LERINILKVTNLVSALKTLKDAGYWVVGLEALAANVTISKIAQYPKVVLVLGAEGSGMRPLTRQHCDIVMQVPMSGDMESLNVSNAAAIAMFCYNNTQGG